MASRLTLAFVVAMASAMPTCLAAAHVSSTAEAGVAKADRDISVPTEPIAAANWPCRAIRLIVPFSPGGVSDVIARPVAQALSDYLGTAVVVENKAGAGGAIGAGWAARAEPDGHTLLFSVSSIVIVPAADRVLGREPAYALEDFVPVARVTADPPVLVVRSDAPWDSAEEFLDAARAAPGRLSYASSGPYATMHLPVAMLEAAADVDLLHVPFTGGGAALAALVGGHVDAVAAGPSIVMPLIRAGKLKALAHWDEQPLLGMPELPAFRDLDYNIRLVQWSGLFAPKGTPPAVIDKLDAAMTAILSDERVRRAIDNTGSPVQHLNAAAFAAYWQEEARALAAEVRRMGRLE